MSRSEQVQRRRLSRRAISVIATVWVALMVAATLLFLVGPSVLNSYDKTHRVRLTCYVDSAEASSVSTRTGKGTGTNLPQVVFRTKDCGTLLLQDGMTEARSKSIAARIKPDSSYTFSIGEGSVKTRWILGLFGGSPTVYGVVGINS